MNVTEIGPHIRRWSSAALLPAWLACRCAPVFNTAASSALDHRLSSALTSHPSSTLIPHPGPPCAAPGHPTALLPMRLLPSLSFTLPTRPQLRLAEACHLLLLPSRPPSRSRPRQWWWQDTRTT